MKKAFKIALNMDTESEQPEQTVQIDDLRNIPDDNRHDNLKNTGRIAETADEF